jgi:hypothetical protein
LITLNDLVGFTELTDADVHAIARHEHVTVLEAICMGCRMMQSSGGQKAIIDFLKDDLQTASSRGDRQLITEIEASLARLGRLNVKAGVPRRKLPQEAPASAGRGWSVVSSRHTGLMRSRPHVHPPGATHDSPLTNLTDAESMYACVVQIEAWRHGKAEQSPEDTAKWESFGRGPRHAFYDWCNTVLAEAEFDETVEMLCQPHYKESVGRPSIPPGRYFRMLFVGQFEGLESVLAHK